MPAQRRMHMGRKNKSSDELCFVSALRGAFLCAPAEDVDNARWEDFLEADDGART